MKNLALLMGALALLPSTQAAKCYGLVLGSGDETAAYQAGVISSLLAKLPPAEAQWSKVSGVAGSAVNAVLMGSRPLGQEQQAAADMKQFWLDASKTPLYEDWWMGPWGALYLKGGIYDPAPLADFLP